MQNLEIPATARTPAVLFDFGQHQLKIKGESYPEDVTEFYGPVFSALDTYLANLGEGQCRFDFENGRRLLALRQGRRHYAGA
jgi:SiaC family regulatory phosphoprotein